MHYVINKQSKIEEASITISIVNSEANFVLYLLPIHLDLRHKRIILILTSVPISVRLHKRKKEAFKLLAKSKHFSIFCSQ